MKIQLKERAIPRSASGDPAFRWLEADDAEGEELNSAHLSVMSVFTRQEIVELVNRALYQLEYQHEAHKTRGKRVREEERAIRLKVKELFHVSWMKATPEQVKRAREEVAKG